MKLRVTATLMAAAALVTLAAGCQRPVRVGGQAQPLTTNAQATPVAPPPSVPPSSPSAPPAASVSLTPPYVSTVVARKAVTKMPSRFYVADGLQLRWIGATQSDVHNLAVLPFGARAISISPDGVYATWNLGGDQMVAKVDGSGRKLLLHNVIVAESSVPTWLPDSRHLLLTQGAPTGQRIVVGISTGKVYSTPLATIAGSLAFSPTGSYVTYRRDDGRIVVAKPDGTVTHVTKYDAKYTANGVSDDGRYVVVIPLVQYGPDVFPSGGRIVDMTTGKTVTLNKYVTEYDNIRPLPGGLFLGFTVLPTGAPDFCVYDLTYATRAYQVIPWNLASSRPLIYNP